VGACRQGFDPRPARLAFLRLVQFFLDKGLKKKAGAVAHPLSKKDKMTYNLKRLEQETICAVDHTFFLTVHAKPMINPWNKT
jgi:hypothetical protein